MNHRASSLALVVLAASSLAACSKSQVAATTTSTAPAPAEATPASEAPAPRRFDVSFPSGPLHLRGWVVRAPDDRPRPVVVYNHGSEDSVPWEVYGDLATWLASHGYVVFFPFRRGVSGSEGVYLETEVSTRASEDRDRVVVDHLVAENDDVTAAIAWVRGQPYADARRVAVAGCSFGGIETLLSAERAPDVYAAVDFAGASATWASSPLLQQRMLAAARAARVPVMFVQAKNDFNTAPSKVLAAEMRAQGKAAELGLYPPRGTTPREGHSFCVTGMTAWGDDVLAFLAANAPR